MRKLEIAVITAIVAGAISIATIMLYNMRISSIAQQVADARTWAQGTTNLSTRWTVIYHYDYEGRQVKLIASNGSLRAMPDRWGLKAGEVIDFIYQPSYTSNARTSSQHLYLIRRGYANLYEPVAGTEPTSASRIPATSVSTR